jgi:hypothetical protein
LPLQKATLCCFDLALSKQPAILLPKYESFYLKGIRVDFVEYLQNEFERRCLSNANYSLRAFARSLETDPAALMRIIKRQRKPGQRTIIKLCEHLHISPELEEKFLADPSEIKSTTTQFTSLHKKTYATIADWYHFAILELINLEEFIPEYHWIAQKLGINITTVQIAVERLVDIDLIRLNEDGSWSRTNQNLSFLPNGHTNRALKVGQIEVLKHATEAIHNIPLAHRDHTSLTFAIDSALLPKVREITTQYRHKINALARQSKKKDSVYELALAIFPWTKDQHQLPEIKSTIKKDKENE